MVICKYFQQGTCRFGSKCRNDHIDLKELLKVDVESAVNGRQWPFSSFGPFKDKPSLPNFIEDQSFDEVRFMCYEARQMNFLERFHHQFNTEALEATNKLKALLQLTPDVIDVVTKVYDTPVESSVSASNALPAHNKNNPFGLGASGTASNSSIFNKSSATASNLGAGGNVFGGTSIFGGGGNSAPTNASASIFGSGSKGLAQGGQSIFGGGGNAMTQNQPSIFGQQQAPASNSVFGVSASQTSIFAQPPEPQQMNVSNSGDGLFAQASQQIQQQQLQQQSNGFGLFAAAAQQSAPMFGQVPPVFGQPMGVSSTPTNPVETSGLFPAASAETQHNMFAQSQLQLQQPPSGFFQQSQHQQTQQQFQQQQVPPPTTSINCTASIYSRLEDLTADEIEAFKANLFTDGKIPFSPPALDFMR